jgi:DNA-binding MarR family transcriptional regulator
MEGVVFMATDRARKGAAQGTTKLFPARVRPGQRLEHLTLAKIARLGVACELSAASVYEPRFGVKNHELKILNVLGFSEPMSLAELSRRAHMDKAWVSRCVGGLERRGLVRKWAKEEDVRVSLVELTDAGQELVREITPTMLAREEELLVGLDEEHVNWILDTLLHRLERMRIRN